MKKDVAFYRSMPLFDLPPHQIKSIRSNIPTTEVALHYGTLNIKLEASLGASQNFLQKHCQHYTNTHYENKARI